MQLHRLVLGLVLAGGLVWAQGPGPCGVLTKAEVSAAVGSTAPEGTLNKTNKAVCDYRLGATGSMVGVLLTAKAAGDTGERTAGELKKRKIAAETVSGLGDSAYAASPGYGMEQVGVYKGSHHVVITVLLVGAPEGKAKTAALALAKAAAGKL